MMTRRSKLDDEQLYEVVIYLARPQVRTEIHAELPASQREQFEQEYADATESYPLPSDSTRHPYYVWPEGANKYGRELRIYFARVAP